MSPRCAQAVLAEAASVTFGSLALVGSDIYVVGAVGDARATVPDLGLYRVPTSGGTATRVVGIDALSSSVRFVVGSDSSSVYWKYAHRVGPAAPAHVSIMRLAQGRDAPTTVYDAEEPNGGGMAVAGEHVYLVPSCGGLRRIPKVGGPAREIVPCTGWVGPVVVDATETFAYLGKGYASTDVRLFRIELATGRLEPWGDPLEHSFLAEEIRLDGSNVYVAGFDMVMRDFRTVQVSAAYRVELTSGHVQKLIDGRQIDGAFGVADGRLYFGSGAVIPSGFDPPAGRTYTLDAHSGGTASELGPWTVDIAFAPGIAYASGEHQLLCFNR
jgi:hypothetical protein